MATTRSAYDVEDPTGLGGFSGIKSLGQLLMPDASKFAEARYYGAKTRQSAAETAASVNQQWMQQRALGALPNSGVPGFIGQINSQPLPGAGPDMNVPVYQPSGNAPIQVTPPQYPPPLSQVVAPGSPGPGGPGPGPGPAMPPPAPPPQGAGVVQAGGPAGPPPMPVPPIPPAGGPPVAPSYPDAASMGGAPPGMGLGAIVAPGDGAAPAGGPPSMLMQMAKPNEVADLVSNPWGPLSTGQQAPEQSSPAPGAPPAPNTTTSNGQVPANDGTLHPGSVTEANGGQKQSGPAGPNGAPAPMALNLGTMMAMAAQSGMDAAMVKQFMSGYVADLYNSGRIDRNMRNELDAQVAQGTIFTQEETTRRTLADRRLAEAGSTGRQNIITGEAARQFNQGTQTTMGPDGRPVLTRQQDIQSGQTGAYDSPAAVEQQRTTAATAAKAREPVYIEDTENGGYRQMPYAQAIAEKRRIVGSELANTMSAQVEVYRTVDGKVTVTKVPAWQVQREGLEPTPAGTEQLKALQARQAELQGNITQRQATGASVQPPPVTAEETQRQEINRAQIRDEVFPKSPGAFTRDVPVRFVGQVEQRINEITDMIRAGASPNMPDADAYRLAIRWMQQQGELQTEVDRPSTYGFGINSGLVSGKKFVGQGDENYVPIGQLKKKDLTPISAMDFAPGGKYAGGRSLGGIVAPQPNPPVPGGKDLGPAPPGAKEGQVVAGQGMRGKVVNGRVIQQ